MIINNETVGISAEVAIAREFCIFVNPEYSARAEKAIIDKLIPYVRPAFQGSDIPLPVKHIAEKRNPVDFMLQGEKTLSVKTNQGKMGKVAPQIIGQPTDSTYFSIMGKELNYNFDYDLKDRYDYQSRAELFKYFSITRITDVLDVYWRYMFDCDYLIHFYNIIGDCQTPQYAVFNKKAVPKWDICKIRFSQTPESWKESCTLYYDNYSIGEFQAHRGRNCLKFRFNMDELSKAFGLNSD